MATGLLFEVEPAAVREAPAAGAAPARRPAPPLPAAGEQVVVGASRDPYTPPERTARKARRLLRRLSACRGIHLRVVTASSLVARDFDLLGRLAARNGVEVTFRIETPDRRLAAILDPTASPPSLRLGALRAARKAGLHAGVLVTVFPGVTDHEPDLEQLFLAARESGAEYLTHEVVRQAAQRYGEVLRALPCRYPRVAARHDMWCRTAPPSPQAVRAEVAARFAELGRRFMLPQRLAIRPPPCARAVQREFDWTSTPPEVGDAHLRPAERSRSSAQAASAAASGGSGGSR